MAKIILGLLIIKKIIMNIKIKNIKIGSFDDSLKVYKNFNGETKFEYMETILKLKKKE